MGRKILQFNTESQLAGDFVYGGRSALSPREEVKYTVESFHADVRTRDLSSANITETLPEINGGPQSVHIYAINGGTFKLTLAVTDAATVDDLPAGTWEIEGKGRIFVESDGTNWQVKEYEDSGSNANGNWKKEVNGQLIQWNGEISLTSDTLVSNWFGTTSGNSYLKSQLITFPISFHSIPDIFPSLDRKATTKGTGTVYTSVSSVSGFTMIGFFKLNGEVADFSYNAIGRWRT